MKKKHFLIISIALVLFEALAFILFIVNTLGYRMDTVEINRIKRYVIDNNYNVNNLEDIFSYRYTVLLTNGRIYQSKPMADNIDSAILHADVIIDLFNEGSFVGNLIINNNYEEVYKNNIIIISIMATSFALIDFLVFFLYYIYLKRSIIDPFNKLDSFARMVAYGNLDIPLEMDKKNLFGSFTEAFDILRSELKKSREAERKANESKKELIAKLSHDIKTPVASIMAASEVGMAIGKDNKYEAIYNKAIQINSLVSNLFDSSLEEIAKLDVVPGDINSLEIKKIIETSDYKGLVKLTSIPECLVVADELRLCQVFDNIISNSYKYANTKIEISSSIVDNYLVFEIEDYGEGCPEDSLPLIMEKYQRGSNAKAKIGAGLGLFLARDFLTRMNGNLEVLNGNHGFLARVYLKLS